MADQPEKTDQNAGTTGDDADEVMQPDGMNPHIVPDKDEVVQPDGMNPHVVPDGTTAHAVPDGFTGHAVPDEDE